MNGAREYASLFATGQHGRLFLVSGSHARGRTFHIHVLPEGLTVAYGNLYQVKDAIEVYGITSGQPGWTETYGWLHEGKWQDDFAALVTERREQIAKSLAAKEMAQADADAAAKKRKSELLANY